MFAFISRVFLCKSAHREPRDSNENIPDLIPKDVLDNIEPSIYDITITFPDLFNDEKEILPSESENNLSRENNLSYE